MVNRGVIPSGLYILFYIYLLVFHIIPWLSISLSGIINFTIWQVIALLSFFFLATLFFVFAVIMFLLFLAD